MFVTNRWIGGLLTNFSEVSKNLKKLKDIEQLISGDEKNKYTKKELGMFEKERQKLERLYGGIKNITKIPDVLFIIDSKLEELSVREAERMNVPAVAITDTNSDPGLVAFPIPANDDAVGSIELIAKYITDVWIEGKNHIKVTKPVGEAEAQSELAKEKTDEPKSLKSKPKPKAKSPNSEKTPSDASSSAKAPKDKKATEGRGK
jgi:small subunit ribosomal protein S2